MGSYARVGLNRHTGKAMTGWEHVLQSLDVIWSTMLAERVIREEFGNPGIRLLGENLTPRTIIRFYQVIKITTDLWEPCYSIIRFMPTATTRQGELEVKIEGIYRPRGHLGDPTPEGVRRVRLFRNESGSGVQSL